jgi:hypothetical protein
VKHIDSSLIVDVEQVDYKKLGYGTYENYPEPYVFPKIVEEEKEDESIEKNNYEFNFYDHI